MRALRPGYAMRVFDFAIAHPDLMRLMAWSSLDLTAESPTEREAAHDTKVASIKKGSWDRDGADLSGIGRQSPAPPDMRIAR